MPTNPTFDTRKRLVRTMPLHIASNARYAIRRSVVAHATPFPRLLPGGLLVDLQQHALANDDRPRPHSVLPVGAELLWR